MKRKEKLIESRHPALILTFGILCCFELCIVIPALQLHIITDSAKDANEGALTLFFVILEAFHEALVLFLACILLGRVWLLYFEYKFKLAKVNQIWRTKINSKDHNFWLNNKNAVGSSKTVLIIVVSFNLIVFLSYSALILITNNSYNGHLSVVTGRFVILVTILPMIIMFRKIRRIFDKNLIKLEMKRLVLISVIYLVLSTVNGVMFHMHYSHYFVSVAYLIQMLFLIATTVVQVCELCVCTCLRVSAFLGN